MNDIILVVLPLCLLVLAAVIAVRVFRKEDNEKQQTRLVWGMAIGTAVGLFLGIAHLVRMGLAISIGLVWGEILAMVMKKK